MTFTSSGTNDYVFQVSGNGSSIKNFKICGNAYTPRGIDVFSSKITIENNEIFNFFTGISIAGGCNDIKIIGNHIFNNGGDGIMVANNHHISIINNTFENNTYGMDCQYLDNLIIDGNQANNNRVGILIVSDSGAIPANNVVYNNVLNDNTETGIEIVHTYNAQIQGNTIRKSPKGISIYGEGLNDFANNRIDSCSITECGTGIEITSSSFNTIRYSAIESNNIGILIHGSFQSLSSGTWMPSKGNMICYSTISNNQLGIEMDDTSENILLSNNIYNNGNGVVLSSLLDNSDDNLIVANRIAYNPGHGLVNYASSIVDATLNWWGSNNNPSNKIIGIYIDYDPWIVLKVYPSNINSIFKVFQINADLTYNSDGSKMDFCLYPHSPEWIPSSVLASFGTDHGTITTPKNTNNGIASSILVIPSYFSGTVYTWIKVDDEFLVLTINIASQTPLYYKAKIFNYFNPNINKNILMKTGIKTKIAANNTNQTSTNSSSNYGGNSGSSTGGSSAYTNTIIAAIMAIIIIGSGVCWLFARK